MLNVNYFRWLWRCELRKPSSFFNCYRYLFRHELGLKIYLKRCKEENKKPKAHEIILAFIILVLALIVEPLQFLVYYICLVPQIFSEWFCSLFDV